MEKQGLGCHRMIFHLIFILKTKHSSTLKQMQMIIINILFKFKADDSFRIIRTLLHRILACSYG